MKRKIRQEIIYFHLWWHLKNVQYACSGALSHDEELGRLFSALYNRCADIIECSYCGDIVDQYVVTVCEEEKGVQLQDRQEG